MLKHDVRMANVLSLASKCSTCTALLKYQTVRRLRVGFAPKHVPALVRRPLFIRETGVLARLVIQLTQPALPGDVKRRERVRCVDGFHIE